MCGLGGDVGGVEPELIFVFAAHGESAAEPVIDACAGGNGEVARVANLKWVLDFAQACQALGVGLELAEAADHVARAGEVVVFGLAVKAVEAQEASLPFGADVRGDVVVHKAADAPEALVAVIRKTGVDVGVFRACPQRAAGAGSRGHNLAKGRGGKQECDGCQVADEASFTCVFLRDQELAS